MEQLYIQKEGLLFSPDGKTILGVDIESGLFTGRIPYGAHFIDDEVFTDSPYQEVTISDSVEKLGKNLFANSKQLKTVKLPPEIKELSPYLFSGCSALTKVFMPNELIGFPEGLFNECSALEEIPFRAGIKVLPEKVFSKCTSLRSLVIPNTVERIESQSVSFCSQLRALVLPESLQFLAEDAFEGCTSLRNIRIDGANKIFFVKEEDGCLYEHTADGDKLRISVCDIQKQQVSFFKENVDDESDDFYSDEDFDEIDETFSSEVSASEEETENLISNDKVLSPQSVEQSIGLAQEERDIIMGENTNNVNENTVSIDENTSSIDENTNKIDDMLKDILAENAGRTAAAPEVALNDQETQVISQMMEVMNDNIKISDEAKVSNDELEKLFSNNENQEENNQDISNQNTDSSYSKFSILLNTVAYSKVLEFTPKGEPPVDSDLFVIAENTILDNDGNKIFTPKLEKCCNTFAHIQDFKRVILLNGLPFENLEFEQFYHHFMANRNVILACEAQSPSKLSEYAKKVCLESRISLERESLLSQRKKISSKNDTLIKLVIQDIYDN